MRSQTCHFEALRHVVVTDLSDDLASQRNIAFCRRPTVACSPSRFEAQVETWRAWPTQFELRRAPVSIELGRR